MIQDFLFGESLDNGRFGQILAGKLGKLCFRNHWVFFGQLHFYFDFDGL